MTQYNTLLLDRSAWDLVIDSGGNIAMAQPPYALAQDVASAVRLFLGELWYNTTKGIPYFEEILGQLPPLSLLTGYIEKAALTVPGVVSAQCIISSFDSREIAGQIQFIDETGAANNVTF
jgi:hypothetical protein